MNPIKLHVLSDLHCEITTWEAPVTDADVVVLAGDIGAHTHGLEWAAQQPAFRGKLILYTPGNHEFYQAEMIGLRKQLYRKAEALRSDGHAIHVLDNDALEIDEVRFLGSTLWTDYRLFGDGVEMAFAMSEAKHGLSDHSVIFFADRGTQLDSYSMRNRFFLPQHAERLHRQSRVWLSEQLSKDHSGKTVVVSHHLPSMLSVADRFKGDVLSAAFASNLEALVEMADLWVHGHTHVASDYYFGKCRVVCNPRGYPGERGTGFRSDFIVEV